MASPQVQEALENLINAIRTELREEFVGLLTPGYTPGYTASGAMGRLVKQVKLRGKPGPKPKALPAKRAKGGRRSPEEVEALKKTILAAVKKTPGSRVEELAVALSLPTKELALPMLQLREEKLITKKGEKRAARYTAK